MPNVVARLEIILNDEGQVLVNGPIEDRLLCYGLLGVAKDSLKDHHDVRASLVKPASDLERVALIGS